MFTVIFPFTFGVLDASPFAPPNTSPVMFPLLTVTFTVFELVDSLVVVAFTVPKAEPP